MEILKGFWPAYQAGFLWGSRDSEYNTQEQLLWNIDNFDIEVFTQSYFNTKQWKNFC